MGMKILARKKIGADLENTDYWEAVMGCALHGKLDVARALLTLHSKADQNAFIAAENALRNMPVYNVYGGYSVKEFIIRWKQWQMSLSQSIDSKTFGTEPNLELLMKVIYNILIFSQRFKQNRFIIFGVFSWWLEMKYGSLANTPMHGMSFLLQNFSTLPLAVSSQNLQGMPIVLLSSGSPIDNLLC